jgi:hypothetical protein
MWLLIVEALIALGLFVFIVWWTVSSRRENPPPDAGDGDKTAGVAGPTEASPPPASPTSASPPPGLQPPDKKS